MNHYFQTKTISTEVLVGH